MKKDYRFIVILLIILGSCTSQKKLGYLNNLPEAGGEQVFTIDIPDYRIQYRDILYVTAKAMTSDGMISDVLAPARSTGGATTMLGEAGQYLLGYDVNPHGKIVLPAIGEILVANLTLEEARVGIQREVDKVFANSTIECKLLSFKFTVIGEVKAPGTYINYNNYLTVFEAIGRAGGINDFGRRDKLLVVRPVPQGTITLTVDLQDKSILSNEAYFMQPNDVVIVEPESKKIFNLNLPTYSFLLTALTSAVTTTLLLINYFGK
jgi:polysaccharide biosynthesis/export protein